MRGDTPRHVQGSDKAAWAQCRSTAVIGRLGFFNFLQDDETVKNTCSTADCPLVAIVREERFARAVSRSRDFG